MGKACFVSSFLSNSNLISAFTPSSVSYHLIRVLSPHPCFIPSSVFYPLIHVLSPHPCFIPSSVFYPRIRDPYPYPCFIPTRCHFAIHDFFFTNAFVYFRIYCKNISGPVGRTSVYIKTGPLISKPDCRIHSETAMEKIRKVIFQFILNDFVRLSE